MITIFTLIRAGIFIQKEARLAT